MAGKLLYFPIRPRDDRSCRVRLRGFVETWTRDQELGAGTLLRSSLVDCQV